MIAEVVFDTPVDHPFRYQIPEGCAVAPGQRVLAPLGGASRAGTVVAVHERHDDQLKTLLRVLDPAAMLAPAQLDVARWIAAESLSSLGSTLAALLPPPPPSVTGPARSRGRRGRASRIERDRGADRGARRDAEGGSSLPPAPSTEHDREYLPTADLHDLEDLRPREPIGADHGWRAGEPRTPVLLVGAGRERKALARIVEATGPVLVLTADVEGAGRWAQRLAKLGPVARLDSGVADTERAESWRRLASGAVRLGVGARSALLTPLPPSATVVLIDEHEAAHKPPGAPRIHSRDVVMERAAREGLTALFTAATPSVEMWWRADSRHIGLDAAPPGPWPAVTITDTRGILRREPLTPPLARAIRETLAAGRRVFLGVSRLTSALACDDCGSVARCETCGIALAYTRAGATLACRLCGAVSPSLDTCKGCHGHRLSPFGWGAERVEHAVRRRFPQARVARYDPDATRGARGEAQRAAAAGADVVIGTRGALRLFGPSSLGLAGFVSPDQLLRVPDFRASERTFALMWAAAERARPDAAVIIQSQNPTHYALAALSRQDLSVFYRHELKFRAELGYPPFRRLALITVREKTAGDSERRADAVATALRGASGLTVYPPAPGDAKGRTRRLVVKGHADLPALLREALAGFDGRKGRGMIEVEVDPVEWRY